MTADSLIPSHRPPTTPGEIISEDFLKPLNLTQAKLADAMRISRVRLNAILNGRRSITADTALRLERVLGPSAGFWLNLQNACDLYAAQRSSTSRDIARLVSFAGWDEHGSPAGKGDE